MDGQLPGEAGASEPVNPQQMERGVDSACCSRRITKRLRHEISSPRKRKKANRSLRTVGSFSSFLLSRRLHQP
jgi:hypothetical protein